MKKRIVGMLAALVLSLCFLPAQAAPAREMQALEMTVDEKMQLLISIADGAIPEEVWSEESGRQGQTVLEIGQAPGGELASQALWAAALLARPTTCLTLEEAEGLYGQIFTEGAWDPSQGLDPAFFTAAEDGVEVNPEAGSLGFGGAHVYSVTFDGTDVTVLYDAYVCSTQETEDVEQLPEELVAWIANVALSLRYAPETEFGYTINGIFLSPAYQAGNLSEWRDADNTEYEYSLKLPGILGVADETPAHRVWQTADGAVTLTLEAREREDGANGFDQAYARLVARNRTENLGFDIRREPEFSRIVAVGAGQYRLYVISDDLSWEYELTLVFPPERQAEYELYAEFIRNSLIMWGISNG